MPDNAGFPLDMAFGFRMPYICNIGYGDGKYFPELVSCFVREEKTHNA
jgi:hypothetical protein